VSFDLRSMKNLSTVIAELDKTQHKKSCVCRWLMPTMDMALVGHLTLTKGTCYLHFDFQGVNPKYFTQVSKFHIILLYLKFQQLR